MKYTVYVSDEMAQKVIEGDNETCQHMHLILRWLKIRTIQFSYFRLDILITCFFAEVAYFFQFEISEMAKIRKEIEFRAKMILMHLLTRVIVSFDEF